MIPSQEIAQSRFRVIELCGYGRKTIGAYSRFSELNEMKKRVELHPLDIGAYYGDGAFAKSTDEVKVVPHPDGLLYGLENIERKLPVNSDHIHMHMLDGSALSIDHAKWVVKRASRFLKPGGLLFFSADYLMFEGYANGRMKETSAPFLEIAGVLKTEYDVLAQAYDYEQVTRWLSAMNLKLYESGGFSRPEIAKNDSQIGTKLTDEAQKIADKFGFSGRLEHEIAKFFGMFSEYATGYGLYFAIAKKE